MKVILENLGPIKRVEFDLSKDLNVIFGKNNIGKSYAITTLYIILKHLLAEFGGSSSRHLQRLYRRRFFPTFSPGFAPFGRQEEGDQISPFLNIIKETRAVFRKEAHLQEYDLSVEFASLLKNVFASVLEELLSNSFNNSFQSVDQLTNGLSNEPLLITIESTQFMLLFQTKDNAIILSEIKFKNPVIAKRSKRNLQTVSSEKGTIMYFKIISSKKSEQVVDKEEGLSSVITALQMILTSFSRDLRDITKAIYFLPASRSGLYQALSTFGALFAELSKSRNFVTKGISLPTISEPMADYFLRLSSMKPEIEDGEVSAIAQQIEHDLLGGKVGFDEETKKLYFWQQSIDKQMDLSFTSSMVSEIAPIVAHFKYILRQEEMEMYEEVDGLPHLIQVQRLPSSLIFIEEPEAHLHPEVQVKLMEFFARLTKHNVKVVMTSHSNYMFNKLSNLLLTNELEPEKVGSYLMRATPEGSVMDSAAMRAEEEGIADENFVDVAEQLYNERLNAYDKINLQE